MRRFVFALSLIACNASSSNGTCTDPTLWHNSGEGGLTCDESYSWSCGGTPYTVTCTCPSAECTCSQGVGSSLTSTTVSNPGYCPTCDTSTMLDVCGFPHH